MGVIRSILTMAFAVVAQQVCARVRAPAVSAPTVETILAHPRVVKTLEDIKADDDRAFAEQKRITEIPAPPYKEKLRAEYYLKRFQELGFKDASIDSEGNVIALRKGSGGGRPKLVVSAHLDTVFPEGTDVTVKEKDGAILAPGIGDDSRGLAALLSLHQGPSTRTRSRPWATCCSSARSARKNSAISAASRRCSATTPISTASSRSTGSASPASSIRRPAAIATK